ncbi:MAG: hypothetical protein ABIN36_06670 [Ferruginibacter sp.]
MKKFLINSFLFFIGFFVLDKVLLFLRNYSPKTEVDKRLEMIITGKINSDILIFGSSRGARDLIASQMTDSLKTSVYSLAFPGSGIEFHEWLLEQTIANKNKKPKAVILVVDDPTELLPNGLLHFRLDRLYPLVKYPVIREKLVEKDGKNEYLNQFFIVSQLGISNFDITQKHFKRLDTLYEDGSMPITFKDERFSGTYSDHISYYNKKDEVSLNVDSYLKFIRRCKDNNIELIIACPPNCYRSTIGFQERLKELAGNDARFMIFDSTKPYTKDGNYYFDDVHLKKNGAIIFTNEMIDYIKASGLL